MRIATIISHFERKDLLMLCIQSIISQNRSPDELMILDDGSKQKCDFDFPHVYIRQEHDGYGKQRLLNKALRETSCDYLTFLDQDCVVPPQWLEIHEAIARPNQMVYAMYTSLDPQESSIVTLPRISNGTIWRLIDKRYSSTPPIWCGAGSACWKSDALKINGFDTRFGWCGGDYNFGLRLKNNGVNAIHFSEYGRYFHLWHEKPWAENKSDWKSGDKLTANILAREWAEITHTPYGIHQQNMNAFDVCRK